MRPRSSPHRPALLEEHTFGFTVSSQSPSGPERRFYACQLSEPTGISKQPVTGGSPALLRRIYTLPAPCLSALLLITVAHRSQTQQKVLLIHSFPTLLQATCKGKVVLIWGGMRKHISTIGMECATFPKTGCPLLVGLHTQMASLYTRTDRWTEEVIKCLTEFLLD
ncbi:hypothetical protein XELAEV_18043009mg [Xenopus laevis]|uniref:Uncharacterized protein n=1 Tax=Xenopus laevis TaxID=8355 RepID=A0A974C572_XENLA|nr:hypothetical protein XELAEV_18043009mg [Xenopus laevis]